MQAFNSKSQTDMKFKAVIFDMDGLLIDSEMHWAKHGPEIWTKLGVIYNEDFRKDIVARRLRDVFQIAKTKYNPKLTWRRTKSVYKNYTQIVYGNDARLLKGARHLLTALGKKGFLVALGTSSSPMSIRLVMKKYNLKKHFHLTVSAFRMKKGKPHPAIYHKTMKLLKVKPEETVIFEDSNVGVKAGKASGAKVIAIPDKRWSHGDFSIADLVAKSLADEKIYKYLGIK